MEKGRKIQYLRILKIIAFLWTCFASVYFWAFISFPTNLYDYPYINTNWISTILLAGSMYGYDIMLFYIAF